MAQQLLASMPFHGGAKVSAPDHRDYLYAGLDYLAAPQNNDLRILAPPVRDQGATSACTAFSGTAVRAALTSKYYLDQGRKPDLGDLLSPRYMYLRTREVDGDPGVDQGASMRGACQALKQYGCSPERFMRWDPKSLDAPPSTEAEEGAKSYGISGYLRLAGQGQALLGAILSWLGDGRPAYIAIYVYDSFMRTGSDGRVPAKKPGEKILGGHALAVFGSFADQSFPGGGCFVVENSWTTAWGAQGWCYIPWAYVLDGTLVEAWGIA